MSILITAASSAQAYQLKSLLNTDTEILLGDYLDLPNIMVATGKMIITPATSSLSYIHQMLALCLDKGIHKIYALRRSELLLLAEARLLFNEFDIELIIPGKEIISAEKTCDMADSKITVIENNKVVLGTLDAQIANKLTNGIFEVNINGNYQIFTAD